MIITNNDLTKKNEQMKEYCNLLNDKVNKLEDIEKKYNNMKDELSHNKPMHVVLDQIGKLNEPLKNERFEASKPCINVDFSQLLMNLK